MSCLGTHGSEWILCTGVRLTGVGCIVKTNQGTHGSEWVWFVEVRLKEAVHVVRK